MTQARKTIVIGKDTDEKLQKCIREYVQHFPTMKKVQISRDKIIDEIADYYLNK